MIACRALRHGVAQIFLDRVDCVFSHGAISGPLAAHDADQAGETIDFKHIITRELLCVARVSRTHKRPSPRNATKNQIRGDGTRQVLIEVAQQKLYIFACNAQDVFDIDLPLVSSNQESSHPRDRK
jgi:predicted GNAT family N-acyltransferase